MNTYIPSSDKIVHQTMVDFSKRTVLKPVHVVQYDSGIPVLAISLYLNGIPYSAPANSYCRIRVGKKDHTYVIKNALGCSDDRNIVYFEIDDQMTYFYGPLNPIIELIIDNRVAGSSPVGIEVDRNPVQENDIESSNEYIDLIDARDRAEAAATSAAESEQTVQTLIDGFGQVVESGKQEINEVKVSAVNEITAVADEAREYANEAKGYRDELSGTITTVAEHSEAIVELETTQNADHDRLRVTEGKALSNEKRIDNLEVLVHKEDYVENDSGTAYIKDVPTNTAPNNVLNVLGANPQKDMTKTARASVLGNTKKYNQLFDIDAVPNSLTKSGVTISKANGLVNISGTASEEIPYGSFIIQTSTRPYVRGHKYGLVSNHTGDWCINGFSMVASKGILNMTGSGVWNNYVAIQLYNGATINATNIFFNIADLTEMYGIGNEPTTIEQFLADYPAYNSRMDYVPSNQLSAPIVENETLCGKNLINPDDIEVSTYNYKINFRAYGRGPILLRGGKTYTFSVDSQVVAQDLYIRDYYAVTELTKKYQATSITYTPTEDVYVSLDVYYANGIPANTHVMLEKGSTATQYEPYQAQTVTFSEPHILNGLSNSKDEVYSYVENGYLVTKKIERDGSVDLGTLNWNYNNGRFSASINGIKHVSSWFDTINACCSLYTVTSGNNLTNKTLAKNDGDNNAIIVVDEDHTDATEFKNYLSGSELVYELATPTITEISRVPLTCDFESVENVLTDNTQFAKEEAVITKGVVKTPATQSIEIVGHNIIDPDKMRVGRDHVTNMQNVNIFKDDYFTGSGYNGATSYPIKVKPNSTLYFKNAGYIYVHLFDINGNYVGDFIYANLIGNKYSIPSNAEYMVYKCYNNKDTSMMCAGYAQFTDYVPHYHTTLLADQLVALKNKFTNPSGIVDVKGISHTYQDDVMERLSIDLSNKKAFVIGDFIDINNAAITRFDAYNCFQFTLSNTFKAIGETLPIMLIDNFTVKTQSDFIYSPTDLTFSGNGNGVVFIRDLSETNANVFKQKMIGYEMFAEYKEPIEFDISDILTDDDKWIPTEPNGTVTFNNDDQLPIKYDIDWLKLGGTQ